MPGFAFMAARAVFFPVRIRIAGIHPAQRDVF
jgi:hypothetical protein